MQSNYVRQNLDNKITSQIQDANLRGALKSLRQQLGDDDPDNAIKVKDVIQATEIYKSAKPPAEQILAGFSPTPVYTQGGQQYLSKDGTQAFVQTKDGVMLVTDLALGNLQEETNQQPKSTIPDMNPEITTQEVIDQYIEYDQPFDEFYPVMNDYVDKVLLTLKDPQIVEQTRQSVSDAYKQIQIQESSANQQLSELPQVEMPQFNCSINVEWRIIMFWMLIMNFNQPIDLTQGILKFIIKPIEEILNNVLGTIRDVGFTLDFWGLHFEWYPFKWIPVFTWWEDLLQYIQREEYKSMCSFIKFDQSKTLGTSIGGQHFIQNKLNTLQGSGNLSATKVQMLQVLQLGYNEFGSGVYSKDKIRKQLGNVI